MNLGSFAEAKVCNCSGLPQGLCHSSELISSPVRGWAAILGWKPSSFTTFHSILAGREVLSALQLFYTSLVVLREFQFCSCTVSERNVQPSSSIHEGLDKRVSGVELPLLFGFLMAGFTDCCFPSAVGSAGIHVPSCCWFSTFEKKVSGMLSHAAFLSVLISSILIYLILTLESFGMQTHVRTSSWESAELHLHLLAVVHGHTTV